MHSLQWIDKLEAAVGLPVLTANQVTVWQGIRLLGDVPRYEALGTLFRTRRRLIAHDQKPSGRRPFAPVVQESTASLIANRVREAIAEGHIAPGAQLGEAELARELGVSRGPLREGLQRLTAEGLVVSIRNRGLFVIDITPERVADVYVARQAVERAAAEQVHLGDPRAAGEALMAIIDTMAVAPDSHAVGDADIVFHERLVALADSPRLSRMHSILLIETRICIRALEVSYGHGDVRFGEHRAIAQSFLDGDARLTDELLVAHMKDAVQRLTVAATAV